MLERLRIPRYQWSCDIVIVGHTGDNAMGAGNQQERLSRKHASESSEAIRRTSRFRDEDMVQSSWRHERRLPKVVFAAPRIGNGAVSIRPYAGKPENLAVPDSVDGSGDNSTSAGNQQERLIDLGWVIGFVDGEGCFSLGFVRQPDRTHRSGYKTGYQVFHEFAVTQGARSIVCLKNLREFFGVGQVLPNRRYDNHKEHLHRYVVRRRSQLLAVIIPFFRRHLLRSSKRQDFQKFAQCVERIEAGLHLTKDGLRIAETTQTMNRQKPRAQLISFLRDQTPDVRDIG